MDKPLFSEHWYRVGSLRPELRSHVQLHRRLYRGETWYLLEDESSSRYHRFSQRAYSVIGLMDGKRTVQEIWQAVNTQLGDDAPVQDDVLQLLGQLHQVDALQTDVTPDVEELFRRGELYEQQEWRARLKNPLALRCSLFDPDRVLDRTMPFVRPLFSIPGLLLWIVLVGVGALLAGSHWGELLQTAKMQAIAPLNLLLLLVTYPCVKLLHEFAHAYGAKLYGGEVHDIGVMFLVFMPVPYVDASAATAFSDKRMRIVVGAAGIMMELALAALAMLLWVAVEPGIVRDLCFNILLIGGVSTLLFNGNPLLRFDGYYVLSDAIDIPNLGQRANAYLAYLVQRYLLRSEAAISPVTARGEAPWFFFYSITSFAYRTLITLAICLFLIDRFFFLGVLLSLWAIYQQLVVPVLKQLRFLFLDPRLRPNRSGALLWTALCLGLLAGLTLGLPVSSLTRFEGVIWPPDDAQLVAETEGFVEVLLAQPGDPVRVGQPLFRLENLLHRGEMAVRQARLEELAARLRVAQVEDRVQTRLVQEEIGALRGEIARLQQKLDALLITSPSDGVMIVPAADDLPGQYVAQGQLLGYVVSADRATARVMVLQQEQDRIKRSVNAVEVRLASALDTVVPGQLLRSVPQASNQLPSKVLSVEGGGRFTSYSEGVSALTTRERLFEYQIELPLPTTQAMIGSRVYVRFDHGSETLWIQYSRRLRQLFLSRLSV